MSTLPVTARTPLPAPLSPVTSCFRQDGRRGVVIDDRTGALWLLEIDPGRHTAEAHRTAVTVPRRPDGDGWVLSEFSASHALDRLLLWTDRPRVYALPSGGVLAELERPRDGRTMCLSPGGRWAVCLGQGEGWWMDVDAPAPGWEHTLAFHAIERDDGSGVEDLYLDHVDSVVTHPCGSAASPDDEEERFWIAAGCYGFVVSHQALARPSGVKRISAESRGFGANIVYDPTDLVRPSGQRHVFVLHGHRCGLSALDPATGELHHCWPRGGPGQQPYGFFYGAVPCGEAPIAWVDSRDGTFLWRPGEEPRPVPGAPGTVLALYPRALLCLGEGGGELLWCDLPG